MTDNRMPVALGERGKHVESGEQGRVIEHRFLWGSSPMVVLELPTGNRIFDASRVVPV